MMLAVQTIGKLMGTSIKTLIVQIASGIVIYSIGALILLKIKNDELYQNISDTIFKMIKIKI